MNRISSAAKTVLVASKIVENRVSELFPNWFDFGSPYAQRIAQNKKDGVSVFNGFSDYEVQDAVAFSTYCKINGVDPESDPDEDTAYEIETGVLGSRSDYEKAALKVIQKMQAPEEISADYLQAVSGVKFNEKAGKLEFE